MLKTAKGTKTARAEAESRRRTREKYYHWQERDLRVRLAIYTDILAKGDFGIRGRVFYRVRVAMIRNELSARENGP